MLRSEHSTDRARSLARLALLCVPLAVGASAHEGKAHGDAAPEPALDRGAFATPSPGSYALPPLGAAADGPVLTSAGEPVRLHALFGDGVVLLSFVYTRCSDAAGCPLATAVLHGVGARVGRDPALARKLRLLTLSFDPEHDTPQVMQTYGRSFSSDGADWRFLTSASEADLAPLLRAYAQTRVREVDESGRETGGFSHLLRVFLIDPERRIRQVYSAYLLDPDALLADVKTLLLESELRAPAQAPIARALPEATISGPGDPRDGYESGSYTTRSAPLAARRGSALDLSQRVATAPLGLPPVPVPADNPVTAAKVALGRRLFFDRRLSLNDTLSCAMCHIPEQGFASNEMATAIGVEGRTVRRNAPTLFNVAYLARLFHDGRETSLEQQVWGPLLAPNEMGNPAIGALIEKLRGLDDYARHFDEAFPGRGLGLETLGMAIASYERTLVSGGSAFDRYRYAGEEQALSPSAVRGLALFSGKAGCAACHPIGARTALFTDQAFHNTGVGYASSMQLASPAPTQRVQAAPGIYLDVPRSIVAEVSEAPPSDLGRYEITQDPRDRWKYRTPTLRNVALTAPYMHDGSLATLEEVVAFYSDGGIPNEGLDPLVRPLGLSGPEQRDLVAFLESLTGSDTRELVADAFAAPVGER